MKWVDQKQTKKEICSLTQLKSKFLAKINI